MASGEQGLRAIRWTLLTKLGRQAVREQSGVVLADDASPATMEMVRDWVLGRESGARFGSDELAVQSLHDFADGPLATYVLGATRADLVAWDLPFAASRMARHWGAAATVLPEVRNPSTGQIVLPERMSPYAGGWSLSLWGAPRPGRPGSWDDGPGKRRLRIRHLDGDDHLSGWSRPAKRTTVAGKTEQTPPAGHPFDMGHLARALSADPDLSFEGACITYGVPSAPDAVVDGELTERHLDALDSRHESEIALFDALLAEADDLERGGFEIDIFRAFSAGSLSSQLLKSLGAVPYRRRLDLPPEDTAAALGATHGGLADVSVARQQMPAVVVDYASAYLEQAWLLGCSKWLTASSILKEDVTAEFTEWIAAVTPDELLDPAAHRRWGLTLVWVRSHGASLPHRRETGPGRWSGGVGPVTCERPIPLMWQDVATAKVSDDDDVLLEIVGATRYTRSGKVSGLEGFRPVTLPGGVTIDLSDPADDFYGGLIEARRAIESDLSLSPETGTRRAGLLKGLGVTVAYGNTVRSDRPGADRPDDWPPVEVMDPWGRRFASDTRRPETPGPWFFPLQGAATTAGCRLVVAILRRLLADAGSIGIAVLTDCVIVPCSTTGGLTDLPGSGEVRVLPRAELAVILERFAALVHPGRPAWKLDKGTAERDLDAIVYGPNKVVIIDPSTGEVTWASEFAGPGVFADPVFGEDLLPDGRRRWWRDGVQLVVDGEIPRGGWLDRMSVSTFRIDSPDLARYFFPPYKGGRRPRWPDGPRPFSRALIAHTAKLGNLRAVQDQSTEAETVRRPVAPVALWDPDPSRWPFLRWTAGGRLFRPVLSTTDDDDVPVAGPDEFVGELSGDVLAAWRLGAPSGTAAAGNFPARMAKGLLVHRPADVLDGIALIGKEGAQLLERQQDLVVDPAAWLTVYGTSATELCGLPLSLVRAAVDEIGPQPTADMSGLARRTLYYLLSGRSSVKAERLVAALVGRALCDLRHFDVSVGEEETTATLVARWLTEVRSRHPRCAWAVCAEPAKAKGEHCERHRRAAAEQRRRERRAPRGSPVSGHARTEEGTG